MGPCASKVDEEAKRNRDLEHQLQRAKQKDSAKIKLLLLGAGESGKSTFFKQMKLLYSESKQFSAAEKETYTGIIYSNIIADAKGLIHATESKKNVEIRAEEAKRAAEEIRKWNAKERTIGPQEAAMLATLWKDQGVQQTWDNRGDVQVQDAFEYYMENIERIGSPGYTPNNGDILRSRVRTSGVVQESFQIDSTKFEMYDVGGQRNERRKWIHSFDGVTSVIFIAAISEYNQVLYEDSNVNRQDEAVELFKQQLESPWFLNTPIILFLNKKDLFREKLGKIPFSVSEGNERRNVDFGGPNCVIGKDYKLDGNDAEFEACYEAACLYLQELYEKQAPQERTQTIYSYFTNSTDTETIHLIMTACKDIILKENLKLGGWFTDP